MGEQLSGKRTVVVGASRGIGRAVAERFAAEGAAVGLAARSVDALDEAASAIERDTDAECVVVGCDLRDHESVEGAVASVAGAFGGLDVVFNSAGLLNRQPIAEAAYEDMEAVIDTNLLGAMRLSKVAIPELVETAGSLIHVSSEAGEKGIGSLPAYCASKAGLNNLVRSLAVEYGPDGVNVTAIAPGTTKTSMNAAVREEDPGWVDEREADIPMGRLGTVEDVANLAVYLASDASSYVTGEVISVDGGSTA